MPDILTRPTKTLREAAQALIAADACNYDRDAMRSEGLFDRLREALRENGSPEAKNVLERSSGSSSPIPADSATPETITISLPALRAVLLRIIDDGYRCSEDCNMKHAWWFQTEKFHGDDPPSDKDIAIRQKFCDKVEERLRQLPARG